STWELITWDACIDDAHEQLLEHKSSLVRQEATKSCNVQELEFKGQEQVMERSAAWRSDPKRLLHERTCKRYDAVSGEPTQLRVICDFIAGMTDEYATRLYEKLFYPHKGSIFDKY